MFTAISPVNESSKAVWTPVVFGLLLLYVPTYIDLYRTFWRSRDGSNGAVMLVLVAWLVWRERNVFRSPHDNSVIAPGWLLLGVGLLIYIVGRSQFVYQFEVGSQIPLLIGISCLLLGPTALKKLWFPVLMLVFVIPVPGSLADQLLLPLKEWVSNFVDFALHRAGYPIARSGVVLMIGPYSLLIADACSGLNSMVALSGIGLIYIYVAGHSDRVLNAAMLLSILPIAFLANVIRVVMLVLITFYRGEDAGQSFHDKAGLIEIAITFGGFFAFDRILIRLSRNKAVKASSTNRIQS